MPQSTDNRRGIVYTISEDIYFSSKDYVADNIPCMGEPMLNVVSSIGNNDRDIDHKHPLSKGGGNDDSNLRVLSQHANRGFKRTASGGIK